MLMCEVDRLRKTVECDVPTRHPFKLTNGIKRSESPAEGLSNPQQQAGGEWDPQLSRHVKLHKPQVTITGGDLATT